MNFVVGACASCGYSTDVDYVNGASDCVSCQTGYEINVAFDDCTGKGRAYVLYMSLYLMLMWCMFYA